ncbi:zinc ribbon domain-containing protein, partial [Myxococcota bacterium]|nr:zinc ribbon domain-containing protein [Myxococcota bacterium]
HFWVWALVPVFNCGAFIHAAIITKRNKYYIFAVLYFLANFLIEEGNDPQMWVWFSTYVIGIIHAWKIRHQVTVESHKATLDKHKAEEKVLQDINKLNDEYGVSAPAPSPAPQSLPVMVERIIIKEIVKIPCPYCGSLAENTVSKCPQCGGDIR